MPKLKKNDIDNIEKQYQEFYAKFNKWIGTLNSEAKNALSHHINELDKEFKKFNDLLVEWKTGDIHNEVGIEGFTNHLNSQLGIIVDKHKELAQKAKAFTPSIMKSVQAYLKMIMEPLQKLCRAVADLASSASNKARNTISTSFDSFKKSVQNMGKKGDAKPSATAANKPKPGDV